MKIVAANLKMNMTYEETNQYLEKIKNYNSKNIIFIPSSIYIPYFVNNNYSVAVQNCYFEDSGAYTGEISPSQIKSMNVDYVLIGHSERRKYFDETNEILNKKIKQAIKNNLKVIYCIGETIEQRKNNETNEILLNQLSVLDDIKEEVIIAYEPVWAIGTNLTPTNEEIKDAISFIKNKYNYLVLYGGSTSDTNIEILNSINEVDGFLVGGASLDIDKLSKIIKTVL